ncbi:MAG: carboxypeptidase regulatory-like domain-containing protein [Planctomycetes bacterium]|nr:carboxypeptidase regulatory-like domain-containing protein [Planctomycetota bacterium]
MRTPSPWTTIAALQGVVIALLAWLVWGGAADAATAPEPAGTTAPAAPDTTAAAAAPAEQPTAAAEPTTPAADAPRPTAAATAIDGTLVHGTIRDRSGNPVQQASLALYRGDDAKPCQSAMPYRSQHFAFPALAPGSYRLTARSGGYRNSEQRFLVTHGLADLRLDVALEPSWLLKVQLLAPDGRPLAGVLSEIEKERPALAGFRDPVAVVAAWNPLPARFPPSDLRETPFSVGRWDGRSMPTGRGSSTLPARYAGVLDLPETRPAHVGAVVGSAVLASAAVEPGQPELVLTIDPHRLLAQFGTVRLQVVDAATQQPVPTAKVGLNDSQSWRQPSPVDAEGRIEIRDLRPGLLRLSVGAEGRSGPSLLVEVTPGATVDLGPIAIVEPFLLRVRVTGRTGDKELRSTLTPLAIPRHAALRPASLSLHGKGDDLQATVPPGRYQLRIGGGGGAWVDVDTARLGSEPLVVALQPEAVLRLDSRELREPVRVVLRTATGAVELDRWITWKSAWEQPLLPGTYTVGQSTIEGGATQQQLVVPAGGARFVLQ